MLEDLKKSKADMASSVSSKAKDFGSFMGTLDTSQYGDNSANAIIGRLKAKLKGIVDFRKNLATLAKRGLGKGIISELAQAGPEEGGQMAQALLNAGGGQIKELNSTYAAIGSQSGALGKQVSSNYYDAGIHATEGLIKGFEHGIRNGHGDVQKAIDEMAGTRPTGRLANRSIAREMAAQTAYGGQAAPVVHVTVQGNVTAERALAKSIAMTIRDEIVRNGKRNGGRTGL
jgi:hypothetical protein